MEPAQKSDFTQLQLEQRQKNPSRQICFDYFPLIVMHIQNKLSFVLKSIFYDISLLKLINCKSRFPALNYL